jgi:hypothetical protein
VLAAEAPGAELDVRCRDGPDGVAATDRLTAPHGRAAQLEVGGHERAAHDRDAAPAAGHPAREADRPRARRPHGRAGGGRDVDAAVLPGREPVGAEHERRDHLAPDRPGPALRGERAGREDQEEQGGEDHARDPATAPRRRGPARGDGALS